MRITSIPFWAKMLFSLACTATILLLLLILFLQPAQRWYLMRGLDDPDPERQVMTARAILNRLHDDPALLEMLMAQLADVPDPAFEHLTYGLDVRGYWRRDTITPEAWLRRIDLFAQSDDPAMRAFAAQQLASRPDLAQSEQLIDMLRPLCEDRSAHVRYNALVAAAELYNPAQGIDPYPQWIIAFSKDGHPAVARHGWILRGLIDLPPVADATWTWEPTDLSASYVQPDRNTNNGESATPAADAVTARQLTADEPWTHEQAMAYVAQARDWAMRTMANDTIAYEVGDVSEENEKPIDRYFSGEQTATPQSLQQLFRSDEPIVRELACVYAAQYFDESTLRKLIRSLLTSYNKNSRLSGALLAGLSGFDVDGIEGFAATTDPATLEMSIDELDEKTDEALNALGLERVSLLRYWETYGDDMLEKQTMRIARWMVGDMPEFDAQMILMLEQPGPMPRTTTALAMLHQGDMRAVDYFLNPRGEPAETLRQTLATMRWWYVLRHYLPDDVPPFDVDADKQVQLLQLDVLRDWLLLNRYQWIQR